MNASGPDDPALPAAAGLLGEEAHALLSVAVEAFGGGLGSYRPYQASYRPGERLVVHYDCEVEPAGGEVDRWTLVAMAAPDLPAGALILEQDGDRVGVWRFPFDPFLPALGSALDSVRVRQLLDGFGVAAGDPRLVVRSYRARRRAVVEARVGTQRLFLKVVRPSAAAELHRLHEAFSPGLPVPPSFGWSDQGIVALGALPGRTLSQQLDQRDAPLPEPGAILELCDRIAAVDVPRARTATVAKAVAYNAKVLASLRPRWEERLATLVDAISVVSREPQVTVHGDLHPSQLLTSDVVTGLLDVDRAATGTVADDYAMLLGHLRVRTASLEPALRARAETFTARLRAACTERTDPAELTLREAGVVLGLATAPFRALLPDWQALTDERLALSERLVTDAERS